MKSTTRIDRKTGTNLQSMTTTLSPSFLAACALKTAFHPNGFRRHQAQVLYAAMTNEQFTADEVLGHLTNEDGSLDTTTAGCVVGNLASLGLIIQCGRIKSPSASRNGSKVSLWCINPPKRETIKTWLVRQGFEAPQRQQELALPA